MCRWPLTAKTWKTQDGIRPAEAGQRECEIGAADERRLLAGGVRAQKDITLDRNPASGCETHKVRIGSRPVRKKGRLGPVCPSGHDSMESVGGGFGRKIESFSPRAGEHVMQKQFKQTTSLQERLAREAEQARARATSLPSGKERDALLRMARLAETASRIDAWLSSPGLRAPE
ncbi:MAG: hypothetical protein WA702_04005 [Bradyrhizobium sp.]|uniref:hypothetical protein n=1 Tax=Bradyrhizobium sp. TaxID=376 RepID=UPI003C7A2A75